MTNNLNNHTYICSGVISNLLSKIYGGEIEYNEDYKNVLIRVSESNRLSLRNMDCEDFMDTDIVLQEIIFGDLEQYNESGIEEVDIVNNVVPIMRQYDTNENGKKRVSLITLGDAVCVPSLTPDRFNINVIKFDLYIKGEITSENNPFKNLEITNTDHINLDDVVKHAEIQMLKES